MEVLTILYLNKNWNLTKEKISKDFMSHHAIRGVLNITCRCSEKMVYDGTLRLHTMMWERPCYMIAEDGFFHY